MKRRKPVGLKMPRNVPLIMWPVLLAVLVLYAFVKGVHVIIKFVLARIEGIRYAKADREAEAAFARWEADCHKPKLHNVGGIKMAGRMVKMEDLGARTGDEPF